MVMAIMRKATCVAMSAVMVAFWPSTVVNATCGVPPDTSDPLTCTQVAIQLFEMTVRDITGTANATQKYVVFTNMENVAYQRFIVTVYDPTLAIGVLGPDPITLTSGGSEGAEPITVRVYAGIANGYTVVYSFDSSDLMCDVNSGVTIPSIAAAGSLTGTGWGYNVTGGSGVIPSSWLPAVTASTLLVQTAAPSANPFDEMYMAVGAQAGLAVLACDYENIMTFTLTGNP